MAWRNVSVGTCPDCGKQRFVSRAQAKKVAKQYSERLSTYPCGDYWHLGRLAPEIKRGTMTRDASRSYPPSHTRKRQRDI